MGKAPNHVQTLSNLVWYYPNQITEIKDSFSFSLNGKTYQVMFTRFCEMTLFRDYTAEVQ